jgi:membrane protein
MRLKQSKLSIFEDITAYDALKFFGKEIFFGDVHTRASAVSFSVFLAIFPATIFLFNLIPYLPIANLQQQILLSFQQVMPVNAYLTLRSTIQDIASNQRGDLLSLGFVLALFFATNGVLAIIQDFNKSEKVFDSRTFLQQRIVALALTIILTLLLVVATVLVIGGGFAIDFIESHNFIKDQFIIAMLWISKWLIIFITAFAAIGTLYYFGPSGYVYKRWRFLLPGAVLATLLFVITSVGFSYYVNKF